jgi:putative phosphotransacetylase
LTWKQDLKQPGQYACQETVIVRGPKGEFKKVRVLGPLRPETQLEISKTDSFTLGVSTPVRESGDLKDTPGIEIIGPAGSVKKDHGVIVALRHIHMSTEDAKKFGVKDKDVVDVIVGNETRKAILTNVLVRVSDKFVLEMHLDIDEGNAVGAGNNDPAYIRKY